MIEIEYTGSLASGYVVDVTTGKEFPFVKGAPVSVPETVAADCVSAVGKVPEFEETA